LVGSDGQKITTPAGWQQHREEMRQMIQHYLTGTIPPSPGNVTGKILDERTVLDGKAKFQRVHLTFGPQESLGLDVAIFIPAEGSGPFPTIVQPSFFPTPGMPPPAPPEAKGDAKDAKSDAKNDAKSDGKTNAKDDSKADAKAEAKSDAKDNSKADAKSDAKANGKGDATARMRAMAVRMADPENAAKSYANVLDRGYAICTFGYQQAGADNATWHNTGFFAAYPDYDWHDLGAWAWSMSRCVDYLETQPWVDKDKFIAVGHSRLGKTTLVAGAFDDRFAMVAPAGSGCAGTGAFRFNGPGRGGKEGLERVCTNFPQWVSPRLKQFSNQVERLPFDQHWLIALVAPRPFLEAEALDDGACNGMATKQAYLAAKPVYEFLGVPDNLGTHFRPGQHALAPDDWKAILDFADWHLRGVKTDQRFDQFPPDEQLH
jgi:hypothetical protein